MARSTNKNKKWSRESPIGCESTVKQFMTRGLGKCLAKAPRSLNQFPLVAQALTKGAPSRSRPPTLRFTTKGNTLYAILLGEPAGKVELRALGSESEYSAPVEQVELLGRDASVNWNQAAYALVIDPPNDVPSRHAVVYKITLGQ